MAWIMRVENEQDVSETFPDFSLTDISNLFKAGGGGGGAGAKDAVTVSADCAVGDINTTIAGEKCSAQTQPHV